MENCQKQVFDHAQNSTSGIPTFKKLGIIDPILKSIEGQGFEKPTKIQEKTIPLAMQGKDILAGSETGSGKTLAFGASIIQNSEKGKGIQALILTPTRELAMQIKKALDEFSRYKPLSITVICGGLSMNPQVYALQKADVVVGTPGRILDHLRRDTLNLKNVKTLVLDEADRMLDMGFIEDVEMIIKQCNRERQTLLFSATLPDKINLLSKRHMKDPVKVLTSSYVDPKKLKQIYYDVTSNLKFSLLVNLLKQERKDLAMVFCNTRRNVDFISKNLKFSGIKSTALHGGYSQEKRNRAMSQFDSGKTDVLICTDVAARGLDIQGVSKVFNYDIPKDSKEYVHRIGRTARAGNEGMAINLLSDRDYENFERVLRDNDVDIPCEETPRVERVNIGWKEDQQPRRNGYHRGGQRNGHQRRGNGYGRNNYN